LLCTARTPMGRDTLAAWLMEPRQPTPFVPGRRRSRNCAGGSISARNWPCWKPRRRAT
jgi:hypothetical protein